MTPMLPMLLGALLLQTSPDVAVAPAADALVERFMAVVPPNAQPTDAPDPDILASLEAANPGREAEVRRLLEAEAACVAPFQAELSRATLREIARSLGDETLGRLIAFYESDDFRRLTGLVEREGGEAALSDGERADLEAVMSRYPLEAFSQAVTTRSMDLFAGHPLFDKMTICHAIRVRAMEEARLEFWVDTP